MPENAQFRELIQRVRNRDQDAARELTEKYDRVIRRVVRIHLRDPRMRQVMDSMDVCQSVLASFFVRTVLGQYELASPEQLINLLTTITRNKLTNQINRFRAQRRDIRKTTAIDCDDGERIAMLDRSSSPVDRAATKEILELVRGRLDAEERSLADRRANGCTWKEIAEEFGGTDVALRKKLTRALDRAMTGLGIEETDDER